MNQKQLFAITDEDRRAADDEIRNKQHEVRYDLRDFTIDFIVQMFREDRFFVPDYQRNFIWKERGKCRFIESVVLGLPIPMMFVADMEDGNLEIVDGAQRIQTLEQFLNGDLRLADLERIPSLNGFTYNDLSPAQQRKLGTKALRIVVLEDSTTAELRQEIFDRVNTSGEKARASEVRRGSLTGPFMDFVRELATSEIFKRLCPITKQSRDRREDEELVLRFLAYSDRHELFRHDVDKFLDKFAKDHRTKFDRARMSAEFFSSMKFVDANFPYGFGKGPSAKSTPRVRFEALAVGVNLALRENKSLVTGSVKAWLESAEFRILTTTHASNSGPRLRDRVHFVRDNLLGGKV